MRRLERVERLEAAHRPRRLLVVFGDDGITPPHLAGGELVEDVAAFCETHKDDLVIHVTYTAGARTMGAGTETEV